MILRDKVCASMGIAGFALFCLSMPFTVNNSDGKWGMLAGMVVFVCAPLLRIWWPSRQAKGE